MLGVELDTKSLVYFVSRTIPEACHQLSGFRFHKTGMHRSGRVCSQTSLLGREGYSALLLLKTGWLPVTAKKKKRRNVPCEAPPFLLCIQKYRILPVGF